MVGAETEEGARPEPPTGEEDEVAEEEEDAREQAEEGTLVGIGAEEGLGRLASIRWALGAPFRRIRRMRMPLWARFATGSLAIVAAVAAATVASLLLYLDDLASALRQERQARTSSWRASSTCREAARLRRSSSSAPT